MKNRIDFEEIRPLIYDYLLDKFNINAENGKSVPCPICGNGHNSPCASVIENGKEKAFYFHCFSCGWYGDVINLVSELENLSSKEAAEKLVESYGETAIIEDNNSFNATIIDKTDNENKVDYSAYFNQCMNNLSKTDYLQRRSIPLEIAIKHRVGYDEKWSHPNVKNAPKTPRLIIPNSDYSYLARDTRLKTPSNQEAYKKQRVGHMQPFNAQELTRNTNEPVYIVEGEINAMSLEAIGLDAVGIGSVSNYRSFINYVKDKQIKRPLVIMLDSDAKGQETQEKLLTELNAINIKAQEIVFPFTSDINDVLINNKEGLINAMNEQSELVKEKISATKETDFDRFIDKIQSDNYRPISTGFDQLDHQLGGGLYSGLTIIASSPSEGKSALAMQICETIAEKQHRNILVFSFEMSKDQLFARSVSRFSFEHGKNDRNRGVTSIEVLQGFNWGKLQGDNYMNMKAGIKRYKDDIAPYITIIDDCQANTDAIIAKINEFEAQHPTDQPPIVLVDYLQLLDTQGKEFVSGCRDITLALKQYAIKKDTVVIAISSINREGQKYGGTMTSLYGSSFAEYGSDTLLMIDFTAIKHHEETDKDKLKREPLRDITITIQKNRMGATGQEIRFAYTPAFNHFTDNPNSELLRKELARIEKKGRIKV